MKYTIATTNTFLNDIKKIKKRHYNLELLFDIVKKLQNGEKLEPKFRDHNLSGNYKGYRECHILNDWLLVYKIEENILTLYLSRTGTHSDLF